MRTDSTSTRDRQDRRGNLPWVVAVAIALFCPTMVASAAAQHDPDVASALEVVRGRAVSGNVVAQVTLASFLYNTGADRAEAIDWFRQAARGGHADAQFHVGQLYHHGIGVPQGDAEALLWYRRAAEGGNAAAQRLIGDFFQQGRGVRTDPAEAVQWYRRAADGDDIRAQYYLGDLYLEGLGVERDYIAAYVWFALAAGQAPLVDNWKALIELRNTAAARMTPKQIEEATRRVDLWRPPIRSAR